MKSKAYVLVLFLIGIFFSCTQADKKEEESACEHELRFNNKGEFKVAQFTDIHWKENDETCEKTIKIIKEVLESEKPDFAILTGDIVVEEPAEEGWASIAKLFSEAQIPWAVLMGNHDAEQKITRQEIFDFLKKQAYYIGNIGSEDIYGTGNFVLPVKGHSTDSVATLLYCMDSNDYTSDSFKYGNYDWIHYNQIEWYREKSKMYTQQNGGKPLPALAYFHIPVPEYNEVIQGGEYYGARNERKASSADINSGFFFSAVEMKDIMGVFVGHDHDNSFIGSKNGIALAYGRVSGLNAYGDLDRGARIVLLHEGKFQFDTWIRTEKGTSELYYHPFGVAAEEEQNGDYLPAQDIKVKKQGVEYTYYEYEGKIKTVHSLKDNKNSKIIKSGELNNFSLDPAERPDYFGFEYNAWIKIPEDGLYKFYTYSDDGSQLYIDDKLVVDNDGSHSLRYQDGKVCLRTGYHKLRLIYFESYMGESLEVGFSSRNYPQALIPNEMLFIKE